MQGILVPPKDEEALESALVTLIEDPDLRWQMGNNGRLDAQKYDWENVTREVLDYYTYLLGSKHIVSTNPTDTIGSTLLR